MLHKTILAQGGTVHYWIARNGTVSDCIVFTHGLSRPYQQFSYRDTAEILHRILQEENIEKTFLVGMSMGGYPSQHFAAMYPDMVKGFVALDTTPLGLKYYSKSDLWWLNQAAPMAKCITTNLLRKSMAWSVSISRYSYQKMLSMLKPLSKAEIIRQMRIAIGG